jgi:putative FmdB family regulatory protein
MPIYEYVCMTCENHFEELVRADETPACPGCGAERVEKQFSVFARSRGTAATTPALTGGAPAPRRSGGCCGGGCCG